MSTPPKEIPTAWTTGFTDIFNTGTWRSALPVHEWRPSPCHVSCPVGNSIPLWIKLIGEGAYEDAWLSLAATNPFPAVTGRVCHHPCEGDCNRVILEGPVGINGLEYFLGDHALQQGWALPAAGESLGRRVAVVGGGPAGLSCAYHLRRLGYEVTVLEARPKLGGLLRYGIPGYRLATGVVDKEIQRILDLGVEVRTDTSVDSAEAFARLRQEYVAVFVAVGAQRAKRLGHLDEAGGATRVLDGLDYLRRVSDGEDLALGERLVVIGGGSAAIDVARTARRQGKQVTVMSLETREIMPAQSEEVSEALEEGVRLVDGAMASGATLTVECLTLECRLVTLDPEAPPGVLRPLPIEGSGFALEADAVIMAIGQDADLGAFGPALQTEQAVLQVDRDTLATSLEGVFAGGDVATMSRYVSVAVGEGRRAAYGIAAYLGHPDAQPLPCLDLSQAVAATEVNVYYFPPAERTERERTAAERRLDDFREVALAYTTAQAASEAGRCMSCGLCIECDNCFVFCPDMAIKKDADRDEHYAVLEQYCKGCGLCVVECPRGAVHLEQVTL